jgi:hypothetical protein
VQGRRRSRSLGVAAAGVVAFAGLVACTSETARPIASPSPFFSTPGPTAVTGPTTVSGPSGGESGPTATGRRGSLEIALDGDVHARATLHQLVSAVYAPPPGGLALVWTAGDTDASTVGIGGASFVGTERTAPTLTVTITVPAQGGFETFVSAGGECAVTFDRTSASGVAGSFRCADLRNANGVSVDATATFSVSG